MSGKGHSPLAASCVTPQVFEMISAVWRRCHTQTQVTLRISLIDQ